MLGDLRTGPGRAVRVAGRSTATITGTLSRGTAGLPELLPPTNVSSSSTTPDEQLPVRAHHRPAQFVQPRPRRLIRAEPQHPLQPSADIPFFCEVTNQIAANHVDNGVRSDGRSSPRSPRSCARRPRTSTARVAVRQEPLDRHRPGRRTRPATAAGPRYSRHALIVGEPVPKLLEGARIVDPADRPSLRSHDPSLLHSSRYAEHVFDSISVDQTAASKILPTG